MNLWSRSERKLASDESEIERLEYKGWRGRREVGSKFLMVDLQVKQKDKYLSNGRSPSKIYYLFMQQGMEGLRQWRV